MTLLATDRPASEAQLRFVDSLLQDRAWEDSLNGLEWERAFERASGSGKLLVKREASLLIDALKACPWRRQSRRQDLPDVPEGHYATASRTGTNDLDFWRVDRPTEGRWAGRTFVKRVIGGRPSVNVRGTEAVAALEAILAAGPADAAALYGRELGQCYRCNRHLTDETSRALGIGPDCRTR